MLSKELFGAFIRLKNIITESCWPVSWSVGEVCFLSPKNKIRVTTVDDDREDAFIADHIEREIIILGRGFS